MKFPRRVAAAVMAIIVCLAIVAGCRAAARNRQDKELAARAAAVAKKPVGQMYEISRNSNFVAQAAADIEFQATIHLPGEALPRRTVIRAKEGTWVVPEGLYTISPFPGHGIECDGKVCKVIE